MFLNLIVSVWLIVFFFLGTNAKAQRKRKSSENDAVKPPRKEDVENKQSRKSTRHSYTRGAKKKILEEANNSKLRQNVQVRVEDCLQNAQKLSTLCRIEQEESNQIKKEETTQPEEISETTDNGDSSKDSSLSEEAQPEKVETPSKIEEEEQPKEEDVVVPKIEEVIISPQEPESEEDDCVIVSEEKPTSSAIPIPPRDESCEEHAQSDVQAGSSGIVSGGREDDDGLLSSPYGRMELGDGAGTALLRFPDDRSDSGVSSLRSGSCASGDERSGSRSSALSSSDEPQHQQQQQDNRILR